MSVRRHISWPICCAVLAVGLTVVVAVLLGGVVLDLRSFLAGKPWRDRPAGLLARAHEGLSVTALFSVPLAVGVLLVGWAGARLVGVRLGRRGAVLWFGGG